jgi:hypothetical protein
MKTLTIKYDDTVKTVALDDFISASRKMLSEFGLESSEDHIREQIGKIERGEKLDVIGVYLQDYIVK